MAHLSLGAYVIVVLLLFLLGIRICQRCEERIQLSDHSGIVWDEIVGYLITMIAIPFSWPSAVAGFVLFRIFDVLKPWPIRWLDRSIHGGLGIMLDDALAGLFAALCLHWLLPWWTG
jgi:phosphatidylglycerophosphatase A